VTEQLSPPSDEAGQTLDNHRPAISDDGRYIAYLVTADAGTQGAGCSILYTDQQAPASSRVTCPADLSEHSEAMAPRFSPDGATVLWLGEDGQQVWTANPLW